MFNICRISFKIVNFFTLRLQTISQRSLVETTILRDNDAIITQYNVKIGKDELLQNLLAKIINTKTRTYNHIIHIFNIYIVLKNVTLHCARLVCIYLYYNIMDRKTTYMNI